MSGSLIGSVLSGIAVPIFEAMGGAGDGVLSWLRTYFNKKKVIERINGPFLEYEHKFRERHGKVKSIGKSMPIEIERVYTDINFVDLSTGLLSEPLQNLEKKFRNRRKRTKNTKAAEKSIFEIANDVPKLMLLGGPGAGKSTFLRKIGLETLKTAESSQYDYDLIPVFVELKRFVSKDITVEQLIQHEFDIAEIPQSKDFTLEALKAGKLLILLDGLDEIPYSNLTLAVQKIRDFADKYDQNRYIASCRRGATYNSILNGFTDVQVAEFDDSQIKSFIDIWFSIGEHVSNDSILRKGDTFLEILNKEKNFSVKELARNPLLLTLLCLVYEDSNYLPHNRVSLYQYAFELFSNKWLAFKNVQPRPLLNEDLNPIMERAMLSKIAYDGLSSDRFFFHEIELTDKINSYIEENVNVPNLDSKQVLNTIKIYQGIVIDQAEGYCSFSHVTFQEYLTAQYIYDHQKIESVICNHISEPRWQEIFCMISGLIVSGSDDFLKKIEEEGRRFIDSPKLQSLISWSELIVERDVSLIDSRGAELLTDNEEWRQLEYCGWMLIIRHAAVFCVLGGLLHSYVKESGVYIKRGERNCLKRKARLSNLLGRYGQSIILSIYEHLRAKRHSSQQKDSFEDLKHLKELMLAVKNARNLACSVIQLEKFERNRSCISKLRSYFEEIGIFQDITPGPLRSNIKILELREESGGNNSSEQDHLTLKMMWENWLNALGLVPYEVVDLSKSEIESLGKYLHIHLLIVTCRIGAVKVSPNAWKNILLCMMRRTI